MEEYRIDEVEHLLQDTSVDDFVNKLEYVAINRSTIRITVENGLAGPILGKKGKNISEIRMLSKAQILFKEDSTCTRFIIINSFDGTCIERALFLLHICVNMFNQHPDDISHASLLDAVRFWRANKKNKKFRIPRMDHNSNNHYESGFWSRAHVSTRSRKSASTPAYEEQVNIELQNRLHDNVVEEQLRQPSEFVLSEFSVQNQEVPHLDQDDFSRLTITEFDRPVSYIEESSIEEPVIPVLPVDVALDRFLCALQKCFPGGIQLFHLGELLNFPEEQKPYMSDSMFNNILQLHRSTEPSKLLEMVHNSRDYVHITPNDTVFVRFSKCSDEKLEDFEAVMIAESDASSVPFNANDKISMAVEEYAIRMATVFKEKPTVKVFSAENFTGELQGDFYACSIVSYLQDYLQYYEDLKCSQEIEETSEFFCLQDEKSAFFIHQLNTIKPFQLSFSEDTLWRLLVGEISMYSEFFKFEGDFIQFQDRKILPVMFKKDEEEILAPVDFASWHRESGMALFDQNLASTSPDDEPDKQCFYYDHVCLKYVQSCVAASVSIYNQSALKMESDLAREIDRFLNENVCDLAKGRDGFKAAGFFPYLVEGREHLIRPGQLLIYNGTYRERCYVMKAEEDDSNNISNQENSYFARHSPSSTKKRTRQKRRSREVPEFETTCKNVRVYYLDYGYSEKVPVSDLYFASPKFLQWPALALPVALYNHELPLSSYKDQHEQCLEASRQNLPCSAFSFWKRREDDGRIFRLRFFENKMPEWSRSSTGPPKVLLMKSNKYIDLIKLPVMKLEAWVNSRAIFGENHAVSLQKAADQA